MPTARKAFPHLAGFLAKMPARAHLDRSRCHYGSNGLVAAPVRSVVGVVSVEPAEATIDGRIEGVPDAAFQFDVFFGTRSHIVVIAVRVQTDPKPLPGIQENWKFRHRWILKASIEVHVKTNGLHWALLRVKNMLAGDAGG